MTTNMQELERSEVEEWSGVALVVALLMVFGALVLLFA